jgi:hypothetical protein
VGLVGAFCPHRRAPLFFGRNEECGLRCVYHGWKFDTTGTCVDLPSEPAESNFKDKVRLKAYPTREWGGVIWAYMGPPEHMPERPPLMEWGLVPPESRRVVKNFQECNYLQALEGDIDTAHVNYLHQNFKPDPRNAGVVRAEGRVDKAPRLMVLNHQSGFAYGGRRGVDSGGYYWRVTQFLWPTFAFIPAYSWPKTCTYTVPVDDHHCFRFSFTYDVEAPLPSDSRSWIQPGEGLGPWSRHWGQFKLSDGLLIDTWLLEQTKENMYGLDRERQRTESYTGIVGIPTQDRAMTEGMGYICDRTEEHLGTTDVAVIAARRGLIDMAQALAKGQEPFCATDAEAYRLRALDVLSPEGQLAPLLDAHRSDITVTLPA